MRALELAPRRDRALARRHPWIFSGAVRRLPDDIEPGEVLPVLDVTGRVVAHAASNPRSQIIGRVVSFDPDARIDEAFFRARVAEACARRGGAPFARLVHGEADGLPGLVIDRYGPWAVLSAQTAGAARVAHLAAAYLVEELGLEGVHERSEADARAREGLAPEEGPLAGVPLPETIELVEEAAGGRTLRFALDPRRGHKTGFYLDQRDNRRLVGERARGRRVLDVFSYTGGFALHAEAGGAESLTLVDASHPALEAAHENAARSGLDPERIEALCGDAFEVLRALLAEERRFDLVVLDPPKLAPRRAALDKALRAYKDLNMHAMRLLDAGGLLATFSCSSVVDEALFRKVVHGASVDAGVPLFAERTLGAAPDHPVLLDFPEGAYLKGLLLRRG